MKILAIPGSLRQNSSNKALLVAASLLVPKAHQIIIYNELALLPLFNSDDEPTINTAVHNLRQQVNECDALMIASPEYAHGITGALKNALDWLVSDLGIIHKPAAVINASSRATHAYEHLTEVLTVMTVNIVQPASIVIPLKNSNMTTEDILADASLVNLLNTSIRELIAAMPSNNLTSHPTHAFEG